MFFAVHKFVKMESYMESRLWDLHVAGVKSRFMQKLSAFIIGVAVIVILPYLHIGVFYYIWYQINQLWIMINVHATASTQFFEGDTSGLQACTSTCTSIVRRTPSRSGQLLFSGCLPYMNAFAT